MEAFQLFEKLKLRCTIPYNKYGNGNGFSFANYSSEELLATINRALDLYKDKDSWNKLVQNAMLSDKLGKFSKSSLDLYIKI